MVVRVRSRIATFLEQIAHFSDFKEKSIHTTKTTKSKAAFTRQTKVDKLVLANSS